MDLRLHWLEMVRIARHSKVLKSFRMEKYIYLKTSVLESVNGKYGDIKITSNQALLRLQYDILFVDTNTTVLA